MESINWLDVILGGVVIISALIGLARGIIKEVLSLVAWFVALYIAWHFAQPVADQYIRSFIDDSLISYLAAFGGLFLVSLFAIGLLNLLVTQIFDAAGLSGFNRLLGMLFGLLRGALISALIVFFASFTPLVKETWWQEAKLASGFGNLAQWGIGLLPENIQTILKRQNDPSSIAVLPQLPSMDNAASNAGSDAMRPQIDTQTRAQQAAQNNALAPQDNQPITLESMPAAPQTPQEPAIILESTQ